jgi:hypothetical protein
MGLDEGITLRLRRGPKAARSRSVGTGYCLTLMLSALMLICINPSKADMNLKLYAYNKMDWSEFQCYNWLIFKGVVGIRKRRMDRTMALGQMRSTWYRDLSPKKQIDAHIKYIRHRYADACDALHHLETRGWH